MSAYTRKEMLDDLNETIDEYADQERRYKARVLAQKESRKTKVVDDKARRQ